MIYDHCVIGGGIVGMASAMALLRRRPGSSVLVLEKETDLARHQTGHNSGVVHSGIYYQPGSLKAELSRKGAVATKEFCAEHGLPVKELGKLLVATDERDARRMEDLVERAAANKIEARRVSAAELREMEPEVAGVGALLVPITASVDYVGITRTMRDVVVQAGGQVELGQTVTGIEESGDQVAITTPGTTWRARRLVVCGGLQADRLARLAGLTSAARIVPFRGEYYQLPRERSGIVERLIYPVPDPTLPFLGVHLTPMVDERVTVGPNAVLGLAREGYRKGSVDRRDVRDILTSPASGDWPGARCGPGRSRCATRCSSAATSPPPAGTARACSCRTCCPTRPASGRRRCSPTARWCTTSCWRRPRAACTCSTRRRPRPPRRSPSAR